MIRNERQYRITLAMRDRLNAQADDAASQNVPEWVRSANRKAIASQLLEMNNELAEYIDFLHRTDHIK